MLVDRWEIVICCVCGSQVLETVSENGTPSYRTIPEAVMKTIGELQDALKNKNPEGEFEILVQNNPGDTETGSKPDKIVVLVADGDFLRLN